MNALPCLDRVTSCEYQQILFEDMRRLLQACPNLLGIKLLDVSGMDDLGLQVSVNFMCLRHLEISCCEGVSPRGPMGLRRLCQRLPQLQDIRFGNCAAITKPQMRMCGRLLEEQGLHVRIVYIGWLGSIDE